jgi:hypothetical protein
MARLLRTLGFGLIHTRKCWYLSGVAIGISHGVKINGIAAGVERGDRLSCGALWPSVNCLFRLGGLLSDAVNLPAANRYWCDP